jgi:hypothetical protein
MAENENRCWPGYEPVKGKRPNSQGSCRPKTESKLTDSEKEFRAQCKRQLKKWEGDRPGKPSQHLHAPGAKATKSNAKTSKRRSAAKRKTADSRGKKRK